MADDDQPKRKKPPFLRLDEIEDEGRAAGDETARKLFDDILSTGGRIDWSAIGRGGPTVARSLLRLSVQAASRNLRSRAAPPSKGQSTPRPARPKALLPRIRKHWRELQTEPADYRLYAFLQGAIGALVTSLVIMVYIKFSYH